MATTTKITLPIDGDDNDVLNGLLAQLDARKSRNQLRAAYYDFKHVMRHVGTIIPKQYVRTAAVLGWSAKAVDTLARRCNLDGFVWPDGDLDSLGWREVWEDNLFATESNSGMVSSLIHGPAFLINTDGGPDEPDALIHVKDAINATGDWNVRTRRLDSLLSINARNDEGEPTALSLYLDGRTIIAEKSGGKWSVDITEHPWGVPAETLAYHPRVGRPFGSSRISRPVMSLQDRAVKTCIRMEGNADVYSIPQMILLGADTSVFKNPDGSVKQAWQFALGRLFVLPDDDTAQSDALARADIKQFQAASPQPHIDMLRQTAQMFSGETSIPLTSLGVSDLSNPSSADSYIASREDLIAEAEGATDDWAPAFRRSMIRALAMKNGLSEIPPDWKTIDTKWRSPVYLSRAAQADAGMKQISAAPWLADTEVGLELLGLDEQQVRRAVAEKRRARSFGVMQQLMDQRDVNNGETEAVSAVPGERPGSQGTADSVVTQ